jgi:hypothetical protein
MNYTPGTSTIHAPPQIARPVTSPAPTQLVDRAPRATHDATLSETQPVTYTVPPVPVERMHESMLVEGAKEALEEQGFVLTHERKFVPMRTKDGQVVYVPVDQVDVRYVGRPYQ